MKARDLLLKLSLFYQGDYVSMNRVLTRQVKVPEFPIEIEKKVNNLGCKWVSIIDDDYPRDLKNSAFAPYVLYYIGNLSLASQTDKNVAVIGSREFSPYGKSCTQKIVSEICSSYTIVSGVAKGIDAIALETASNLNGKCIGIIGSGFDHFYPIENYSLFNILKEKGLVLSEYPPFVGPSPDKFPARNRIIAGISKGILITEAKIKSGTMITVSFGQSLDKEIMCVPYPIGKDSGCNQLIKEGAYLVETSDDVLDLMGNVENREKTLIEE